MSRRNEIKTIITVAAATAITTSPNFNLSPPYKNETIVSAISPFMICVKSDVEQECAHQEKNLSSPPLAQLLVSK
jgi:hypothetical protein